MQRRNHAPPHLAVPEYPVHGSDRYSPVPSTPQYPQYPQHPAPTMMHDIRRDGSPDCSMGGRSPHLPGPSPMQQHFVLPNKQEEPAEEVFSPANQPRDAPRAMTRWVPPLSAIPPEHIYQCLDRLRTENPGRFLELLRDRRDYPNSIADVMSQLLDTTEPSPLAVAMLRPYLQQLNLLPPAHPRVALRPYHGQPDAPSSHWAANLEVVRGPDGRTTVVPRRGAQVGFGLNVHNPGVQFVPCMPAVAGAACIAPVAALPVQAPIFFGAQPWPY